MHHSCLSLSNKTSFFQFRQVENIHGYLKKSFRFVLVPYPHRQSTKRMMNFLLIISRCMQAVGPLLAKAKKSLICAKYPMSSKFYLLKWKRYFSQFIGKYLKIEQVEYLFHYFKFKMWLALFYVNSLSTILNFAGRLYIIWSNLRRDWQLGLWMLL